MTKVPFAESRRLLIVIESSSVIRKRKRNSKKKLKVMGRNSKNTAHGWHAVGVNDKCERP